MSLSRIKHSLLRLSTEEKIVGIGCLVTLISHFFPWYSTTFLSDQRSIVENGFSGDMGVIGFATFIMTIISALYLVAENLRIHLPYFSLPKQKIILFLMGEVTFLTLMIIAVYTKRSLGFTNAELRFGIYSAFIGAIAGTIAMLLHIQQRQREETRAFFDHSEETSVEARHVVPSDTVARESAAEISETELEEESFNVQRRKEPVQIDIESYKERYQVPEAPRETEEEISQAVPDETDATAESDELFTLDEPETLEKVTVEEAEMDKEHQEIDPGEDEEVEIKEVKIDDIELKEKKERKKEPSGSFYED